MGGKTSTATNQVSIPPEVLARYNSVNATAQNVAQTPFQQYSTNPNSFVAPLDPTQQAGVQNTNAAAGMAQPYFQTGTGFALAGAQPVNAQPLDTSSYMNPYLQTVLGSTAAQINQNNQQAMSGATGNAMQQGFFGGDRSGIASAVLQGQQNLAAGQVYSGIASDAYTQALQAAQQQQGVQLGAGQANRAALQQTGQSLAELGTGAQGAAISGAQAQLGAGQVEQQTQQAGLTALYNQFLQQQSYPFQTAQFLANIAEGTGALSGSTTTSTTPGGMFMSDERLKEDMRPIGKGFDGANIYRFRYKDDPANVTRIGFSAQEMERQHPEAVHEIGGPGGFKAIDQTAATDEAARRGFAMAAANDEEPPRQARQVGGMSQWGAYPSGVNPMSVAELLQAQAQMYGPYTQGGLYGGASSGAPYGGAQGHVPPANLPVPQMLMPHPAPMPQGMTMPQAAHDVAGMADDVKGWRDDAHMAHQAADWVAAPTQGQFINNVIQNAATPDAGTVPFAAGGFARAGFQDGGDPGDPNNDDPYKTQGPGLNIPTAETQHPKLATAPAPSAGGGGGGLGQVLGMGSDLANIAKAAPGIGSMASGLGSGLAGLFGGAGAAGAGMAGVGAGIGAGASGMASLLPFLALLKDGGRVGYAAGGDPIESALEGGDPQSSDPVESALLRRFMASRAAQAAPAADNQDAGPPESAPGGGAAAPPPAGFAGATPPGASAEAAPSGFDLGSIPGDQARQHILALEGTGKNPSSSAVGPGQFIRGTFIRMARKVFPEMASMSDDQIGALHGTAKGNAMQAQMIPALDDENSSALQAAGLPATPVNRHIAWVLGPGGAKKVLTADPSTPLSALLSPQAISANRRIMEGKTAGDFIGWAAKGMNRAKGGFAGARHGYQTDGFVDPDVAVDPSGGQDEDDRRRLEAAPQVDPAIVAQANPQLAQQVVANRQLAAAGDPNAPPAAKAAVAGQDDAPAPVSARAPPPPPPVDAAAPPPVGVAGAARSQGPVGVAGAAPPYDPAMSSGPMGSAIAAQENATDRAQRLAAAQTSHDPLHGNWLQRAGQWVSQPDHFMPLISAVAGTLAAPTKYPLVALSQGALSGANTYQQQRAYEMQNTLSEQERASLGLGEVTGAYQAGTQRQQVQQQMFQNAVSFMHTRYTPVAQTGPDNLPGYKDNQTGQFVSASDYGRTMQQVMGGTIAGIRSGDPVAGLTAASQGIQPSSASESAPNGIDRSTAANPPPAGGNRPDGSGPPAAPAGSVAASSPGSGPPPAPTIHRQGTGAPTAAGSASQAGTPGVHALTYPPGSFGARVGGGEFRQPANTMPQIDPSILTDTTNPDLLYNQGMALRNMGDPQQAAAGEKMIDQAQRYRDGTDLPVEKATNQPYMGYRNLKNTSDQRAVIEANYGRERTQEDAAANDWENDQREQGQVLNHLIKGYQVVDTGELSGEFGKLTSAVNSVPWLKDKLAPELKQYMSAVGEADKQTARLQYMQAAASALGAHAPATTMGIMGRAAPDITKGAGARFDLTAQLVGLRNQSRAYYRDWPQFKNQVDDVSAYKHAWFGAHPLQQYEDDAYARIPHFAGMTDAEKAAHAWRPKTAAEAAKVPKGTAYYKPGTSEVWEN